MTGELKPLVRGWAHERRNGVELWRWRSDEGDWVAACAGAGVEAATRAFAEVENGGAALSSFPSDGLGAMSEELEAGRAYWVSAVVDARTGERFRAEEFEVATRDGDLLTHVDGESTNRRSIDSPSHGSGSLRVTTRVGDPSVLLVTSAGSRTRRRSAGLQRPTGPCWSTWKRQRLRDWLRCAEFRFFASRESATLYTTTA